MFFKWSKNQRQSWGNLIAESLWPWKSYPLCVCFLKFNLTRSLFRFTFTLFNGCMKGVWKDQPTLSNLGLVIWELFREKRKSKTWKQRNCKITNCWEPSKFFAHIILFVGYQYILRGMIFLFSCYLILSSEYWNTFAKSKVLQNIWIEMEIWWSLLQRLEYVPMFTNGLDDVENT